MRWYFNARWYDPEMGRFTSRDPMLQFWTPYSYVGNQPLSLVDPDGLQADLIGVDPNSNDFQNAMGVQSRPGVYTVMTHSNREGTGPAIWSVADKAYRSVSPRTLANIIRKDPSWNGRDVDMLVCFAAGWAQVVADELDVYVRASPGKVVVGQTRSGEIDYWTADIDDWWTFVPEETQFTTVPEK